MVLATLLWLFGHYHHLPPELFVFPNWNSTLIKQPSPSPMAQATMIAPCSCFYVFNDPKNSMTVQSCSIASFIIHILDLASRLQDSSVWQQKSEIPSHWRLNNIPLHRHSTFSYSLFTWYHGSLHFLAVKNNDATNMHVEIPFHEYLLALLGHIPQKWHCWII